MTIENGGSYDQINKWEWDVETPIDKWAEPIKSMMKKETSLLLTLEPEQIYSSVRNVEKLATVISLHGNKFPVLFCGQRGRDNERRVTL